MEKRKETLSVTKVCRFCLSLDGPLRNLHDRSKEPRGTIPFALKILSCLSVEVFPSDKMPAYICNRCTFFIDLFYGYKQICRQADESILQYVQIGIPLEPMVWPTAFQMFDNETVHNNEVKKSNNAEIVKTVKVEGGAMIEVTSQDLIDSDEGDENVYNVKIKDGLDEESTCIKVVTSKDNQEFPQKKPTRSESVDDCDTEPPQGLSDGCWSCDQCECTYPLQQLLELHKMQKHRARTVPCDQCDAMFYTKYDLATHQLCHSDEMPFECIACDRQFRRLVLLKRHERMMHSDLPQQRCPHCPATFLSMEECEAHQKRHTRTGVRSFMCPLCDKKFHDRSALQKHKDVVHPTQMELACEYCPERFSTMSKLTRHVRTHASERSYPCKYCNKSFLKSHHYTRHLRMKHRDATGPFTSSEVYRCEQCEDTFGTQDELIYHSAIHATQNLTCPLCQEKFENVDAVTAHIKSHVDGLEFQCDYCELVFISKEKLDCHLITVHEEENPQQAELGVNESSMEIDVDEDEEDNSINLKDEGDHMVVEIKRANDFMFTNTQDDSDDRNDNTYSEESETDVTYMETSIETPLVVKESPVKAPPQVVVAKPAAIVIAPTKPVIKTERNDNALSAGILRKAEEVKRYVQRPSETSVPNKKVSKAESNTSGGTSDKSLRLLEKELQELKRTTSRNDTPKAPAKTAECLRSNRRPPLHASTPKLRSTDEKKAQSLLRTPVTERKGNEKRAAKEPKMKEDVKSLSAVREEKESKGYGNSSKEEKETEVKENDTPMNVVKNEAADKSSEERVRRSTRPSKIKDYAKMVQDSRGSDKDDDSDDDDDEYVDTEVSEVRTKRRIPPAKPQPKLSKSMPVPATPARKRGRPRKDQSIDVPPKIKKDETDDEEIDHEKTEAVDNKSKAKSNADHKNDSQKKTNTDENSNTDGAKTPVTEQKLPANVLVSPTGQTLKKVPIKSLPPGVKPMPLPANARPMGPGELCEMQIGKKVVKVQKIVMTKAEVEAMAKKGLVEMKDGTMVLKQGIKIPTSDPVALKSSLVGEDVSKESLSKKDKAAPTRCDLEQE